MKKLIVLLALAALGPFALAACGGSDDNSTSSTTSTTSTTSGGGGGGGGGSTVAVAADPSGQLLFEQSSLTAKSGTDTFEFTNDSATTHDFCIEGADPECTDQISGSSATLTADLQPGTYTFYCSVDGHRDAGMEGTLTVE